MRRTTVLFWAFGLAALLLATGCGGATKTPTVSGISPSSATTTTSTPTIAAHVKVTPEGATFGATQTQKYTAAMSDGTAASFTWSLSDCTDNCGTLTADGMYTAPATVSKVTSMRVRAISQSNSSMVGIAYLTLMPISVTVSPTAVARMGPNAARPFAAAVKYDSMHQGVIWTLSGAGCSGSACGTVTDATATSVMYHAPSIAPDPPTIMLKANSVTDPNQSGVAGLIVTGSAAQYTLQGSYAFLIQGKRSSDTSDTTDSGGDVAMAGHLHIDGEGVVSGVWDATLKASGGIMEPISGRYSIDAEGVGTLSLQASSGMWNFAMAVKPGGDEAALLWTPDNPIPTSIGIQSGYMLRQDTNKFSMGSVEGDRVLALTFMNTGALGRVTSDVAGNVSNGQMDLTWKGGSMYFFTSGTVTGAFTSPDALTGRGTAALTVAPGPDASLETFHFAYYIVSDQKMLLVQADPNTWQWPVLRGEARRQKGGGTFTNGSWNIPVIYNLNSDDAGNWFTPFATIGVIRPNGAGSLTEIWDNNEIVEDVGTVITLKSSASGTYSVSPNGRVQLSLPGVSLNLYHPHVGVAYLTDVNQGYVIREQIFGTPFGYFEAQTSAPFGGYGLAGTYNASAAGPPRTFKGEQDIGLVTLASDGSAAVFISAGFQLLNSTGTYAVSDDGRGVMNLTDIGSGKQKTIVFWAVSANRLLALVSMSADDQDPMLVELSR
jgi:hypothetical protein